LVSVKFEKIEGQIINRTMQIQTLKHFITFRIGWDDSSGGL
jgi:hypothetical protein